MTLMTTGECLGRYELHGEIGQGGMSVVYRAYDPQLRRHVAVKVMHPFLAEQKEARARFAREAIAVARLHHPHIIEIFDYSDEHTDRTYIVTELVEGRPLSALLENGPLMPPESALVLLRPIVDALATAHAAGIIHRDLKPENILIGPAALKLTDFGVARILDSQTLTVTGTLLGSPAYMAPEYVDGQSTDARSDIFSLGVMFYQMTVGTLPFTAPSPHALLKKIAAGAFIPPEQANTQVHAGIGRMIKRCLALSPQDRYQRATDLLEALDIFLSRLELDATNDLSTLLAEPQAFGNNLAASLVERYRSLGYRALKSGHVGEALQHFDRGLSIAPNDPGIRRFLGRTARVMWMKRLGAAAALAVALATGATFLKTTPPSASSERVRAQRLLPLVPAAKPFTPVASTPVEPARPVVKFILRGRGALIIDDQAQAREATGEFTSHLDSGPHTARYIGAERTDTHTFIVAPSNTTTVVLDVRTMAPTSRADDISPSPVRLVEFKPAGQWVTVYVDGNPAPVVKEAMRNFTIPLTYGKHHLRMTNDRAQPLEQDLTVSALEPAHMMLLRLRPLDARLRLEGAPDGAVVEVADRLFMMNEHTRADPIFVPLPEGQGAQVYEVVVRSQDGKKEYLRQRVLFRPGEQQTLAIGTNPL